MNTLKSMTPLQWLIVLLSLNSAIAGATAQLTDLFGAVAAHYIVSLVTFANTILGAFMVPLGGQNAQIHNVMAMPGIESIKVNTKANPTLAAIAVDENNEKIAPVAGADARISEIAKGAA